MHHYNSKFMSYHDIKIKLLFLNDVLLGHIGRCEGVDYASDIDFRRMIQSQKEQSSYDATQ